MEKYTKILDDKIKKAFLSPEHEEVPEEILKQEVEYIINNINDLKKHGKAIFQNNANNIENDIEFIKKTAHIQENISSISEITSQLSKYLNGVFNSISYKSMTNVLPPSAIPAILGNFVGSMYNTNLVENEYSGNIANMEIEVVAMISKILGYDSLKSTGHFTFGGTGAYLFALKLALTKCLGKSSRFSGITSKPQILVSEAGHYAAKTCSDWLGIGMNNVRTIKLNDDNSMNLSNLEEVLEECFKNGQEVSMIVATIGSTDSFAIDDIKAISKICEKYVKTHNLKKKPLIYADAVIGWAWTVFNGYDFTNNPLEFSYDTLKSIKHSYERIKYIYYADVVGIDFHKTGFTPYNCSMICIKDMKEIEYLSRDKDKMSYLYHSSIYTPGEYTLECSRGGNYALSAWYNLKYFGLEGYRTLLGSITSSQNTLRNAIAKDNQFVCVNKENNGFVTLFRVYPKYINAKEQYNNEYYNLNFKDDLKKFNLFQYKVVKELEKSLKDNAPYLSFTSCFRQNSHGESISAIKAYPMSPYADISREKMQQNIISIIKKAINNISD